MSACLLVPLVFAAGVAWACAPPDTGIPRPPPSLAATPGSGIVGSTTTVSGKSFAPSSVEIRWDGIGGPLLATGNGPDFSSSVTIPATTAGGHHLVAFTRTGQNPDPPASTAFEVTPTPAPTPTPTQPSPSFSPSTGLQSTPTSLLAAPPDTLGPAIAATALTSGNGTRNVTRNGEVRLFCGRFEETVAGSCGAESTVALQARTSRRRSPTRSVLRLGAKRFQADAGRPVLLKFQLSKASMKILRAAKKVRMRGTVEARDGNGNVTRATFGLTLKAPRPPGR